MFPASWRAMFARTQDKYGCTIQEIVAYKRLEKKTVDLEDTKGKNKHKHNNDDEKNSRNRS